MFVSVYESLSLTVCLNVRFDKFFPFSSQYWEGECSIERRSGLASKQYIKLIPMKTASGEISHRVTIQRLLFAQDISSTGSPRQGNQKCNGK